MYLVEQTCQVLIKKIFVKISLLSLFYFSLQKKYLNEKTLLFILFDYWFFS